MTSPYPGYIAWPIYAVMLLVILVRFQFFNRTLIERSFTLSLTFMLATSLLRERLVQNALADAALLAVPASRQLGMCGLAFASAEYLAFIALLSGMPDTVVKRRLVFYRLAALACSAVSLWFGTEARQRNSQIALTGGWDEVFYAVALLAVPIALSWRLFTVGITEARRGSMRIRARLVALLLAGEGVITGAACILGVVLAAGETMGITHTVETRMYTQSRDFFFINAGATFLSAIAIIRTTFARLGMNESSRQWRKLRPFWADLVEAFPKITLGMRTPRRFQPVSLDLLHQTVVEIRDGLIRLRPYVQNLPDEAVVRFPDGKRVCRGEEEAAADAWGLVLAWRSKPDLDPPVSAPENSATRSKAQEFHQELAELLLLAKWWRFARDTLPAALPASRNLVLQSSTRK